MGEEGRRSEGRMEIVKPIRAIQVVSGELFVGVDSQ